MCVASVRQRLTDLHRAGFPLKSVTSAGGIDLFQLFLASIESNGYFTIHSPTYRFGGLQLKQINIEILDKKEQ